MVIVVGKAGEARHAAGVVVLEPLEEFAQFLPAFLLLLQPLAFHLRWDSEGKRKDDQASQTKSDGNNKQPLTLFRVPERLHTSCGEPEGLVVLHKVTD